MDIIWKETSWERYIIGKESSRERVILGKGHYWERGILAKRHSVKETLLGKRHPGKGTLINLNERFVFYHLGNGTFKRVGHLFSAKPYFSSSRTVKNKSALAIPNILSLRHRADNCTYRRDTDIPSLTIQ